MFEATVAANEMQWRLREVARSIALQSSALEEQERALFQNIIEMLDNDG
ncbi:MAG: hypothetical protein VB032_00265 [Burkholderiaceae bacterium]|nr:hypothetical protein [Burkholderiaceae bacterium]